MTTEEWNRLHGYDEHGEPMQRLVWEGTGDGPPRNDARVGTRWVWLVAVGGRANRDNIRVALRPHKGVWVADGIHGPVDDEQNTFVADTDEDYADVIKKAYAMYLMGGGA